MTNTPGEQGEGAQPRPLQDVIRQNLKRWRTSARLTQQQLADRMSEAGFSWSRETVFQVESGRRRVSVEELVGLSMLDSSAGSLLNSKEPVAVSDAMSVQAVELSAVVGAEGERRALVQSLQAAKRRVLDFARERDFAMMREDEALAHAIKIEEAIAQLDRRERDRRYAEGRSTPEDLAQIEAEQHERAELARSNEERRAKRRAEQERRDAANAEFLERLEAVSKPESLS